MNRIFRLALFIGIMISIILMVLIIGSRALAQEGNSQGTMDGVGAGKAQAETATSQSLFPNATYFASQGLVFMPVSSSMTYQGGVAGCRSSNVPGDYFAPLNIPHGSLVDALEVVYYNPNAVAVLNSYAGVVFGTDAGGWSSVGYVDFNVLSAGYHLQSISMNHEINNYNNSYSFIWHSPGLDTQLCQVRLYYRAPIWMFSALPVVHK
jgi:hypothetical protein